MNSSLKRISALTFRNFKEILRDPLSLVFTIGLPLFMEILFYFIFHKMTSQFEMISLAPGIVAFSQSFLSLFVGMLISVDRHSSFLTRLYVSKAKSHEFIIGYILSVIPIVLFQSILFFVVGVIIEPSIFSIGILYAILMSLFTSIFFIITGILIGTICSERSVGGIASIFISGQSLLSGMWFPMDKFSDTIIAIMNALPFRNANMLLQNVMVGINDGLKDLLFPMLIVLGYTILNFIIAIFLYKKKMSSK